MQNNANRDFNTTNTSLADGSYTARYYVNDTANNYNNTERRSFTLDTIFPGIQYQTPTETASVFISRSNIQVNVTATDTNSLTNITIQLFNSSGARIRYNTTTTSPNNITYPGLADGDYTINATATDLANTINATESRTVTIDATNPGVTINSPTGITYSVDNAAVNITLNENGTCLFSLDAGAANTRSEEH